MGRKRRFSKEQLQSEFDSWLAKEPGFTRDTMPLLEYRRMLARNQYHGLVKGPHQYHVSMRGDVTHDEYRLQCRLYDRMRYHRRKAARTVKLNDEPLPPLVAVQTSVSE
jgi:hypothetical protein